MTRAEDYAVYPMRGQETEPALSVALATRQLQKKELLQGQPNKIDSRLRGNDERV